MAQFIRIGPFYLNVDHIVGVTLKESPERYAESATISMTNGGTVTATGPTLDALRDWIDNKADCYKIMGE